MEGENEPPDYGYWLNAGWELGMFTVHTLTSPNRKMEKAPQTKHQLPEYVLVR